MGVIHHNNFTSEAVNCKIILKATLLNKKTTGGRGLSPNCSHKKKLAEQHKCTEGKKLHGPFHWQNGLSRFHPPFYILARFSSFLRQRRHVLLEVDPKSSFFNTVWLYRKCTQRDLWSRFWWDEFEVEFWQACAYLKTSAKHLQCLLSLSALLVALRLFNVLVYLSQGTLKEDHTIIGLLGHP